MTAHARRSMPADRSVEIKVDDFTLTGLLQWDATAGDFDVTDVFLNQQGKALLVDNPDKLGAMHNGEFRSFAHLLRFEAEEA